MHVSFVAVGVIVAGLCAGCSQPVSPTRLPSIQSNAPPLALAAANATTVASPAAADQVTQEVPFKGDLEGVVTLHFNQPPLTWWFMSGSGNATQLGRFTVTVTSLLGTSIEHAAGYYTFTAANGDTLNAFFVGRAQTDIQIFSIVEEASISGGSGRFAGAGGAFTITRLYDTTTGATTGSFEGTISAGRGRNQ